MEGRCFGFFVALLLKLSFGACESSEDASNDILGEEYGQIFHSLPSLFEYLLDILHERPEILEKDDVTFFQDVQQETCEGDAKRKREVDTQCAVQEMSLGKDNLDVFKRNIITEDQSNDIHTNVDRGEIITTPKAKSISENNLKNTAAIKNTSQFKSDNNKLNNHENKISKRKSEMSTKAKYTKKVKKNVNYDDSFIGSIDWTKFYLTPDEVEEQAIKTERAIEDHNKNKGK